MQPIGSISRVLVTTNFLWSMDARTKRAVQFCSDQNSHFTNTGTWYAVCTVDDHEQTKKKNAVENVLVTLYLFCGYSLSVFFFLAVCKRELIVNTSSRAFIRIQRKYQSPNRIISFSSCFYLIYFSTRSSDVSHIDTGRRR